jgi:hypothetical protein
MLKSLLPRSWRATLLALFCLFSAVPAFAAEDDIDGTWKLETNVFENQCKITGDFTFRATNVKNSYTCQFTSVQTCGKGSVMTSVTVQQSCTAQRVGKQVAIKSKVDKILKRQPAIDNIGYYADNFIISITKPGAEMVGGHYDEIRQLKARFWRVRDLTS